MTEREHAYFVTREFYLAGLEERARQRGCIPSGLVEGGQLDERVRRFGDALDGDIAGLDERAQLHARRLRPDLNPNMVERSLRHLAAVASGRRRWSDRAWLSR